MRDVAPGASIGYGATYKVQKPSRIATIAVGYADGFLRALSVSTGEAGPVGYIGDYPVPIVGRVSMDFITVDVTDVPPELARRGAWVEVMGHRVTVDDLTDRAGTIGYELLSRLGQRVYASTSAGPEPHGQASQEPVRLPELRGGGPRWAGKCAACGEWNTHRSRRPTRRGDAGLRAGAQPPRAASSSSRR